MAIVTTLSRPKERMSRGASPDKVLKTLRCRRRKSRISNDGAKATRTEQNFTRRKFCMKQLVHVFVAFVAIALLVAPPALGQSDNPTNARPSASNPSGSGTSTSGGRDDNGDQGRDRMTTTTGKSTPKGSNDPVPSDTTGRQKAGTNNEGSAGAR
jgi:hypothetical protein